MVINLMMIVLMVGVHSQNEQLLAQMPMKRVEIETKLSNQRRQNQEVGIVKIVISVVSVFRGVDAKLEKLGLGKAEAMVEKMRHFGVELDDARESKEQRLLEQKPSSCEGVIISNSHRCLGYKHEFRESIQNRENREDEKARPR